MRRRETVADFVLRTMTEGYDHRLANLGWLHSAYLVAFSAFGYCYAFHRSLKPVRRQLAARDTAIISMRLGVPG